MATVCARTGCGNSLEGKQEGARFCSGACRQAEWRTTHVSYVHRQPATCPRCDIEFVPADGNHRVSQQVYCSRQCVKGQRYGAAPVWSGSGRAVCGGCGGSRGDSAHPSYCRPCLWARMLWSTYKITPEQFAAKLAEQDGRCPIGGEALDVGIEALSGSRRATRVDHCHKTGSFRGILCHRHNLGLGYFGAAPALLRRAADYLEGARR
jgi:hypothetical protein